MQKVNPFPAMTCQLAESPHCLIHTSQLSRDWKMLDSAQICHSEKVYCPYCGTHRMRGVDQSVCNHRFSSIISASQEGSNIADPHFSAFSIQIIVAQPCSSTHGTTGKTDHLWLLLWHCQPGSTATHVLYFIRKWSLKQLLCPD